MTPEEAILQWITATTGLDAYQAPIRSEQDRPSGDYCTFQIVTINVPDYDNVRAEGKDSDFITKTSQSDAEVTISLNVWKPYGYQDLMRLNHSVDFWESRNLLSQGSAAINRLGDPQDLTGLGDTNWRDRWQMDITFFIRFETEFDWNRLKQWEIHGSFTRVDDTGEIESIIKYPA